MKTARQEYIEGGVKSALRFFNDFLKSERADFYLGNNQLSQVQFVFAVEEDAGLEVRLDETILPENDRYYTGRRLGAVYHRAHNQRFFELEKLSAIDKKRHRKVILTVEHVFAMLYRVSEESDVDLTSLAGLPSAKDVTPKEMRHSFLFDEAVQRPPESDQEIVEGKQKPAKGIDYFINEPPRPEGRGI